MRPAPRDSTSRSRGREAQPQEAEAARLRPVRGEGWADDRGDRRRRRQPARRVEAGCLRLAGAAAVRAAASSAGEAVRFEALPRLAASDRLRRVQSRERGCDARFQTLRSSAAPQSQASLRSSTPTPPRGALGRPRGSLGRVCGWRRSRSCEQVAAPAVSCPCPGRSRRHGKRSSGTSASGRGRRRRRDRGRSAGMPFYSPHDLRHRRGSLWHASGMPARELAERMGHEKASMSLDVYARVMPPDEAEAADPTDEGLSRPGVVAV
jgi:hypothetical protein